MEKRKIEELILLCLLLLVIIWSFWAWWQYTHLSPINTTKYVTITKDRVVEKIKRIPVTIEKIITIEKEALIKQKPGLPDEFKNDPNKQALSYGIVKAYEGDTSVLSYIDVKTGLPDLFVKQEPLPAFSFMNKREYYFKGAYSTNSQIQASLGCDWNVLRVKNVKTELWGEVRGYFNTEDDTNIRKTNLECLVGVGVRW